MILKAKHNIFLYTFFKQYAIWIIKRNFNTIKIFGEIKKKNLPILLIANHISWWDGFWAFYLNMNIFKRKFYFMMLEEQLRKYWFFNYTGGFSVNRKSKSIVETLNYTTELLNNNKNLVLIFPQGEIQTMHNQVILFEKGLERVLKNKGNYIQIVFLVNLVDFFSNPKPGIYLYISEYTDSDFIIKNIENKYNEFYKQCVEMQKQLIVEA
jgi:1-acyl-sn-glycerol-3-phosphate acyltransferase